MTAEELSDAVLAFLRERIGAVGADACGGYGYYLYRVEHDIGLTKYEIDLFNRLKGTRRLFHAGTGLGPLTAGLAATGTQCVGFELDVGRYEGALVLRDTLAPGTDYELRNAMYPEGLVPEDRPHDATLLFTNVAAGMDDAWQDKLIDSFSRFERVILDLRLFGYDRETEADRQVLADRIRARGLPVEPIEIGDHIAHYVEIIVPNPVIEPEPVPEPQAPEMSGSERPVSALERIRQWFAFGHKGQRH